MPVILYAEDDLEQREMMRVVLRDIDVTLIEASDGREALRRIEDHQPDLILLDLFMPNLDGHGVMDAIRTNPEASHIPIIVLSAWPTGDNRDRARQAGAVEFIAKPYDPLELVDRVKKQLNAKTVLTS